MASDGFSIIILAAGSSSRMGEPKQQLPIGNETLLARTTSLAIQSNIGNVEVVLGFQQKANRELLKNQPVDIIFNPQWETGMGSSIKAGLHHVLSKRPQTEAIIILVCDQPLLQSRHLNMLVEKYHKTKSSVVASAYSGTSGVPALFSQTLFDDLLKVRDDEGAKRIIQQHPGEVIIFPEGAIDLDTPEDYKNFLQQHSKKMP